MKRRLITCTLFPLLGRNTISIFHNIIVSKEKQIYVPDNKKIPSFNNSALHIHTAQRKLKPKDLLDDTVLLIHDGPKISFQCVTNTSLDLDGIMYACSPESFDWFTHPTRVTNMATGHVILNVEKLKTVHARWTLENINSPIPVHSVYYTPSPISVKELLTISTKPIQSEQVWLVHLRLSSFSFWHFHVSVKFVAHVLSHPVAQPFLVITKNKTRKRKLIE